MAADGTQGETEWCAEAGSWVSMQRGMPYVQERMAVLGTSSHTGAQHCVPPLHPASAHAPAVCGDDTVGLERLHVCQKGPAEGRRR
jgi:hypothetical protein